jgi:hypothetical protein
MFESACNPDEENESEPDRFPTTCETMVCTQTLNVDYEDLLDCFCNPTSGWIAGTPPEIVNDCDCPPPPPPIEHDCVVNVDDPSLNSVPAINTCECVEDGSDEHVNYGDGCGCCQPPLNTEAAGDLINALDCQTGIDITINEPDCDDPSPCGTLDENGDCPPGAAAGANGSDLIMHIDPLLSYVDITYGA